MIFTAIYDIWSAFKEFGSQAYKFGLYAAFLYIIIIITINLINLRRSKNAASISKILSKLLIAVLLGVYSSYTISLTLSGREAGSRTGYLSLVPGTTIFSNGHLSVVSVENWLLFLPFGFLVPILWKYFRSMLRTGILAFISSMSIEIAQFITGRGYFEVDDIILNTFGALCGYLVFASIYYAIMAIKKRVIIDVSHECKTNPPLGALYDRYIISHEWLLIPIQLFPVASMVKIIMGFSSDPGQISQSWSRPFAFVVLKMIGVFYGKAALTAATITDFDALLALQSTYFDLIEKITRKIAHVTEYALLAIFVWALIYSRTYIKRLFSYMAGIIVVMMVGLFDEFNQTHIEGRFGSLHDVGVDLLGAAIAMALMYIISRKMISYYRKKLAKKE